MATYSAIQLVTFLERPNRFIAHCLTKDGEMIVVHVKNTGRCKELLIPGVCVAVNHQPFAHRKTHYDLVAVKKEGQWFNIDSQLPNELVAEAIESNMIIFPQLKGTITEIKREVTYGSSRFDFCLTTDLGETMLIEVKGMTLEEHGVGYFPDAPSVRALKHIQTLIKAKQDGWKIGVVFVVQFEQISYATLNRSMQPQLYDVFEEGMGSGLDVLAYRCQVSPSTISIAEQVPFKL